MTAAGEPSWVPIETIIAFNADEVAKTGERHELRDRAALQRALAHPWNVWVYFMDRDIAVLAARLYTSLANARAFAAGNKRTALRAAAAFVEANGHGLDLPPDPRHAIDRLLGYFDGRLGRRGSSSGSACGWRRADGYASRLTPANAPAAASRMPPRGRLSRPPHLVFFFSAITAPSSSIQPRLAVPTTNISSMIAQQHPTQKSPGSRPSRRRSYRGPRRSSTDTGGGNRTLRAAALPGGTPSKPPGAVILPQRSLFRSREAVHRQAPRAHATSAWRVIRPERSIPLRLDLDPRACVRLGAEKMLYQGRVEAKCSAA
jgi:prophage maintenance system killer protein